KLTVNPTIYTSCIQQFWDSAKVKTINEDVHIQALIDGKNIIVTEASIRRDIQLPDAEGTACLPNDTIFEELARIGFVKVFVNHQLGDMSHHKKIFVTPSLIKKVFANMKREEKSFSRIITPLFETMMVQALEEVDEGSKVLDLEKAKTAQAKEIDDLKKRVKKLERKKKSRTLGGCIQTRGMIDNIDQDVKITLVDETQGRMNEEDMFGVNDLDGDEVIMDVIAGENVDYYAATTPQISKDEFTLAQTLMENKASKPKARGVIIQKSSEFRTTSSLQPSQLPQAKEKGKGIMVEPKKPLKKKDQIAIDEEVERKLEAQIKAKMEEEERIAMEKDEANIVVVKQWDEVQAKIDANMELAQKLQTEEQE
nr:hypothetical protein [Tanacetum cinerariifolium]